MTPITSPLKAAAIGAFALSLPATAAFAEGLEFGGIFVPEFDYITGDDSFLELDLEVTMGYRNGPFYAGIGQYVDVDVDGSDDWYAFDEHYLMLGYGGLLITYGHVQGAGGVFPDDYFGTTDVTSSVDNTVRVDYAPGGDSGILEHIAVSYQLDEDDVQDAIEVGVRLGFNGTQIGLAYEGDDESTGLLVAHDFGDVRLHAYGNNTPLNSDAYDLGFAAFRTFGSVEIGGWVEFLPSEAVDGPIEALGVIMYYETQIGLLNMQVRNEREGDVTIVEGALVIPFGINAPYTEERRQTAEHSRRFGF